MRIAPAFNAPVFDAANAYRAILSALSRPGTVHDLPAPPDPPAPLSPAMSAVILTLCDFDTPLWLAPPFAAVRRWCDFHTGAPMAEPADAAFAVAPLGAVPDLTALSPGTDERPDRSATLVIGCERLGGSDLRLAGPGIDGTTPFASDALSPKFRAAWAANGRRFPRGVDVILCAGTRVAALSRTTRIVEAG
ncbi:MAG: phosphonate C-P lyase system protein PhnH [Pseudomonadota bacterium]